MKTRHSRTYFIAEQFVHVLKQHEQKLDHNHVKNQLNLMTYADYFRKCQYSDCKCSH